MERGLAELVWSSTLVFMAGTPIHPYTYGESRPSKVLSNSCLCLLRSVVASSASRVSNFLNNIVSRFWHRNPGTVVPMLIHVTLNKKVILPSIDFLFSFDRELE